MKNRYFAIILLFIISCSQAKMSRGDKETDLQKVSLDKLGNNFQIYFNSDSTYAFSVQQEKTSARNPNPSLRFFVYDLKEAKIIFEDNLSAGRVQWKSTYQIEIILTPGIVSKDDQKGHFGYIYDVKSGKKSDL